MNVPSNKEMKQTKPAMARMARSSLLISVFYARQKLAAEPHLSGSRQRDSLRQPAGNLATRYGDPLRSLASRTAWTRFRSDTLTRLAVSYSLPRSGGTDAPSPAWAGIALLSNQRGVEQGVEADNPHIACWVRLAA